MGDEAPAGPITRWSLLQRMHAKIQGLPYKEPKEPAPEDMTKAQAVKKAYQDFYGIPVGMTKKTADGINNGKEFKVEPHYAKSWYFNRSAPECEVQEDDSMVGYDPGWSGTTAPFDPRFPHQNQMSNCEQNYFDYHRCRYLKGEDYVNCNYFKSAYMQLCHYHKIQEWDEQVEAGTHKYVAFPSKDDE